METDTHVNHLFLLDFLERKRVLGQLSNVLEQVWFADTSERRGHARSSVFDTLSRVNFEEARDLDVVFNEVVELLRSFDIGTTRTGYLGLFNPHPTFASVVAEALASIFSCQLGSKSHCEIGVEVEDLLVKYFCDRFGFDPERCDGIFTTGASEAHLTAVFAALNHRWPEVSMLGLRNLPMNPTVYASSQTHHSIHKALRVTGLGEEVLREIPVTPSFRIDLMELRHAIASDLEKGLAPWLVVANVGSTASGAIDPIPEMVEICKEYRLWLHADAAWGGGAILSSKQAQLFEGMNGADSISLDAHKWLAMPPSCGLLLLRHEGLLTRCFETDTTYMPGGHSIPDPFGRSLQWTRRFNGLKLLMTLMSVGRAGYEDMIEHQLSVANYFRKGLHSSGWSIANSSPLPIICFQTALSLPAGHAPDDFHKALLSSIVDYGEFWLSSVWLPGRGICLRACITNFRTCNQEIDILLRRLSEARLRLV